MTENFVFSDISSRVEEELAEVPLKRNMNIIGPRHLGHIVGVLVTEEEKGYCLDELAYRINKDYRRMLRPAEALVVAPLLNGAMQFASDLMQRLTLPVELDTIKIESYAGATGSSGEPKIHKDFSRSVYGRHVLLIEDIVDTGRTIKFVRELLEHKNAKTVRVATFLDKACAREVDVDAEYVGFRIPDMFVVGYGLDYHHQLRNLPFVGVYKE
ncbi:hypoxanthine phosphoribosyltransferase [Candidatus Woesearchaeota archaeon]|nr:hypoxanthine phosphoribosyltransferase [Candidatus Woesearchaeota archaeon]